MVSMDNADVPVPPVVAVVEITLEEHISEPTQIVDIPVPQMLEELQERILERVDQIVDVPVPLDQPGDQACRVSADTVHRQGCCRAYCDTATGPSVSDCGEGGGRPACAVHRQKYGRASVEVGKAVKVVPQERISERICEQIDDDLDPQRADLALDDFVTLLMNSGIPVSSDRIWDVIDGVVPDGGTCISWCQQVQVAQAIFLDSAHCAS